MLKTSGEAGGYAQIFIFVQKLCNLDHYLYDFENFLTLSKTSDCVGLKLCLKMSKTSGEAGGYAQIFIFLKLRQGSGRERQGWRKVKGLKA